jgi:phosphoserine phosphatase RsbU/P
MRLLVAEDDPVILRVLKRLFETDYEVTAVGSGDEAWRILAQENGPRLAVLDWHMPGMEGADICRRAHALAGLTYVLLLTATRKSAEDVVAGFEAGADDYVFKPFDAAELKARVAVGKRTLELEESLSQRVTDLQIAISQIRRLEGLLPICAWCKRIRNDQNSWEQLETYITAHSDATFNHGICPECLEKHKRS